MQEILKILGKRIADLRAKNNFTQEKLAELAGCTTNHIAKLESARTNPSFELLINIAAAFNIEMKELFNFDEYQDNSYIKNRIKEKINRIDNKNLKILYKIISAIIS